LVTGKNRGSGEHLETRGSEVAIEGQRSADRQLLHDHETQAINGVRPVGAVRAKKVPGPVLERHLRVDDTQVRLPANAPQKRESGGEQPASLQQRYRFVDNKR